MQSERRRRVAGSDARQSAGKRLLCGGAGLCLLLLGSLIANTRNAASNVGGSYWVLEQGGGAIDAAGAAWLDGRPASEENDAVAGQPGRQAVSGDCFVLHMMTYGEFQAKRSERYNDSWLWAQRNKCHFLSVAVQKESCAHWSRGGLHHSFCTLQELLNTMQQTSARWLVVAGGASNVGLSESFSLGDATANGDLEANAVLYPDGLQLWQNTKAGRALVCRLWGLVWAWGQPAEPVSQGSAAARPLHAHTLESSLLAVALPASDTEGRWLVDQIKNSDGIVWAEDVPDSKSTSEELAPTEGDLFAVSLNRAFAADPRCVNSMISDTLDESKLAACPFKVRFSFPRDKCIASSRYQFPQLILPSVACPPVPGVDAMRRDQLGRYAFVITFTELGLRFKKAMSMPLDTFRRVAEHHPDADLVFATGPLERWSDDRAEAFAELRKAVGDEFGGRVKHIELETIVEEDLAEDLRKENRRAANCCGWSEYQKLGLWNLDQYDAVLQIDVDVRVNEPIHELFSCARVFDFLSTPDPQVALQGGFYLLRPNRRIFREMREVLGKPGLYNPTSGWNQTGPLFGQHYGDTNRAWRRRVPQAFAMETPQGFLFWFFHIHKAAAPAFRTAQLETCAYNFRTSLPSHNGGFLCPESLSLALEAKQSNFAIKACHDCTYRSYSVSRLLSKISNPAGT